MKSLILTFTILFGLEVYATNTFYIINPSQTQKKREDAAYLHIDGPAVDQDGNGGQLKLYVRNCGMVLIPKNSDGKAPKAGQKIHATLKESCKISDWN